MLNNFLAHDLVVKLCGLLLGQSVVYLTLPRLDHHRLVWVADVRQRVAISGCFAAESFLVLESRMLVLDETFGGGLMFSRGVAVQPVHDILKLSLLVLFRWLCRLAW